MTRLLNGWLLAILLAAGIPFYWYMLDTGPHVAHALPVSIAGLRSAAMSMPGQRPAQLRMETIARKDITRNMMVAGSGLRTASTAMRAYQLVVPGAPPIVIDSRLPDSPSYPGAMHDLDRAAGARFARAAARASHVIVLQPQAGGTAAPGHPSAPQVQPVAPGVVAVTLAGLSPGSRMVYVAMADGREYLFTGEAAPLAASWAEMRLPARLATRHRPAGYRTALAAWLRTIHRLHRQAPHMTIVAAHDWATLPASQGGFSD